jgi:RNA polymerase sigma-70 factor (ECF subfamily)
MMLKKLIREIQKKRSKAERQLFDATTERLMAVALRYVVDQHVARDVLQESYIRIFKGLKKFEYSSEAECWSWMNRIVAREALRWIKKSKRWNEIKQNGSSPLISISPEHPCYEDEKFNMLKCLRPEERFVFNLYALEGYSHKEIAEEMELAESSSRSLLTRARKKLQTQIQKMNNYEERQIQRS